MEGIDVANFMAHYWIAVVIGIVVIWEIVYLLLVRYGKPEVHQTFEDFAYQQKGAALMITMLSVLVVGICFAAGTKIVLSFFWTVAQVLFWMAVIVTGIWGFITFNVWLGEKVKRVK